MIKKINKFLILLIIVFGLIWLYTASDCARAQSQLKYQLEVRKGLEINQDALNSQIRAYQKYLPDNADKPFPEYIEWKIRSQAAEHSIDSNIAFAIAVCESTLNPYAKNPNSSAGGLFQFIDSTWEEKCIGNKMNADDNLNCFIKLFLTESFRWNASKFCWNK